MRAAIPLLLLLILPACEGEAPPCALPVLQTQEVGGAVPIADPLGPGERVEDVLTVEIQGSEGAPQDGLFLSWVLDCEEDPIDVDCAPTEVQAGSVVTCAVIDETEPGIAPYDFVCRVRLRVGAGDEDVCSTTGEVYTIEGRHEEAMPGR